VVEWWWGESGCGFCVESIFARKRGWAEMEIWSGKIEMK
jgi:hypothetical protein